MSIRPAHPPRHMARSGGKRQQRHQMRALVPGGRSIDAVGDGERARKSDPRRNHAPTRRFVTLHLLRDGDIVRI